jgi:aspartyl-tRNA(Asn)/glutamyl-tRNA(Gln) amidotransferase subunit A
MTIIQAAAAIRRGELSSEELTRRSIELADRLDPIIGTYVTRTDDQALQAARRADTELASGIDRGPLHGIPFGVKDILATEDAPTTCQSIVHDREWGSGRDAPVVARVRAAGAVITGKTTTMEFATGVPDPDKPFPLPRNPWDTGRWAGGSSSGTGSGVAVGMFLAGLGTDTGGSIRIPAAFCGTSGLMPTFGRVPKSGCVPLGYSLDHVGPLARSAADCAAVLQVIAGYDPSDTSCSTRGVPDYSGELNGTLRGLTIGVERTNHFPVGADPALGERFDDAVALLEELGARVVEVTFPYYFETVWAANITMSAESTAYHMPDLRSRWSDYFRATRICVAQGVLVTAADYVQAQRVRRVVQRKLAELFEDVDLVVSPTTATPSPRFEDLDLELDPKPEVYFTTYWNAVGNPALAVPMGPSVDGLPLSLEIAGRPFEEVLLLRAGDAYQRITDWHLQVPPLVAADPVESSITIGTIDRLVRTYRPVPTAADRSQTEQLIGAAGLSPSAEEVGLLSESYQMMRTATEALYGVPEARYEVPGLIFEAAPEL